MNTNRADASAEVQDSRRVARHLMEGIWLRESLGKTVLAEHARLEHEGE